MGDFRIEIHAVGGHGCQREVKNGGTVYGCGQDTCPDCIAARCVAELVRAGADVKSAKLVHWPGEAGEVVDEFDPIRTRGNTRASRSRHGSF